MDNDQRNNMQNKHQADIDKAVMDSIAKKLLEQRENINKNNPPSPNYNNSYRTTNNTNQDSPTIMSVDMKNNYSRTSQPSASSKTVMMDNQKMKNIPPASNSRKENRKNRRVKRTVGVINGILFTVMVLGISIGLSIFIISSIGDLTGLFKQDSDVSITLEKDKTSLSDVSKVLSNSGVIQQPLVFQMYINYKIEDDVEFNDGEYNFNSNMSYDEILAVLNNTHSDKEVIKLTFPEGMNSFEVAQRLEENNVCSADAFIEALQERVAQYEFETQIDNVSTRYVKLEGYIFPNTHEFFIGEMPSSVVEKFLSDFNRKITKEMLTDIEKRGMTLDEIVTLASVIQKEAGLQEEMYKVSSVLHNRLKSKTLTKLQSDVTRDYVNNFITPYVDAAKNTIYADNYNTYKVDGLPVGPICNPGMEAITAAIYPDYTTFYYFVTDIDWNYYYSKTFEQHESVIAKLKADGKYETSHGLSTEEDKEEEETAS